MTLVAETPRFADRWTRMFVTGWRASMSVTMMSGSYFTVYTGVDNALTGENGTTQRANLLSPNVYGTKDPNNYLVRSPFGSAAPGTYGNLGNAAIEGPGLLQVNSSLSRAFRIKERHTVQLRMDAYNALNHATFFSGDQNINSTTFGVVSSMFYAPRIIELGLHYSF